MPRLYIIAGCNGAGKTTASYTILPEILKCKEFVNADEIAKGLSPFQPEKVAIEAGRIMLNRIDNLLHNNESFAFETTLATRSYIKLIQKAQSKNYTVTLLYFWLNSIDLAVERVKYRVSTGGHDIPKNVILRRYNLGLENLSKLYIPICDDWLIIDNSETPLQVIAEKVKNGKINIYNDSIYLKITEL